MLHGTLIGKIIQYFLVRASDTTVKRNSSAATNNDSPDKAPGEPQTKRISESIQPEQKEE